jgi:hypothetical protein
LVDGIVVGSALSLLVTEDFAFKTFLQSNYRKFTFQLTTLKEKFYTELTFLSILNTADFDWVAVYDGEKNYVNN